MRSYRFVAEVTFKELFPANALNNMQLQHKSERIFVHIFILKVKLLKIALLIPIAAISAILMSIAIFGCVCVCVCVCMCVCVCVHIDRCTVKNLKIFF